MLLAFAVGLQRRAVGRGLCTGGIMALLVAVTNWTCHGGASWFWCGVEATGGGGGGCLGGSMVHDGSCVWLVDRGVCVIQKGVFH